VRALLFDVQGRHVPGIEGREATVTRTTPDGGVEIDPEDLVVRAAKAVDAALAAAGGRPIAAVGSCTFWHSVLGVDAAGDPVTPVYTWADMRGDARRALGEKLDERAFHARTGCLFHASYPPAKILWVAQTRPDVFRRAARWMSFGEFLFSRLFGRAVCTVSMASGAGLLDIHQRRFDAPILAALGLREDQLWPLGDVGQTLQGLREPYASRWPALKDVPWCPPVGDGGCNSLGSGCSTSNRIAVMLGTSGALRASWKAERVEIPWGLFCYLANRERVVMGGALSNGGNLVEWVRGAYRLGAPEEVEREIAAMAPDAHGLTFLPFLAGERSPGWTPDARGMLLGLRLATRPIDILRAGLEAVAIQFGLLHDLVVKAVPAAREVVASGGGFVNSPAWAQILADVLNRPVALSAEPEASSRGAALLAMEALGWIRSAEDLPAALGKTFAPDAGRHAAYRAAAERHARRYRELVQ
ncbi:MAG TPA: gluconokinase, partial [Planctomycetota bacterium]